MDSIEDLTSPSTPSTPANPLASNDQKAKVAFDQKMAQMQEQQQENLAKMQATTLGLPYINLEKFPIGPEALKTVTEEEAQQYKVLPFYRSAKELRIGAVRPGTPAVLNLVNQLQEKFHIPVQLYLISEKSFNSAIAQYKNLPSIREQKEGVEITEKDLNQFKQDLTNITDLQNIIEGVSTTDVVTAVIALGLQMRASDIHIESEEEDVKIRYRIDGVLHDAASITKQAFPRISNRLKLLSRLKLNITNEPQDGRFTIFLSDDKIDVRVSIIPTTYGESIVMRLLKSSATGLKFEDLGLRGSAFAKLEREITKPNGMIITTGPTGSGKTTTLYSILLKLNTEDTKIITLEDPVEYKLEGINQSQVDKKKNYDFASGLRAILRQDPDIIMVGEIRDFETADTAINASLTGHLVISTLHTNSAAGAIPRFLSMGVKPFLLSPSLNAMIGQRLVRRICASCIKKADLSEADLKKVDAILQAIPESEKLDLAGKTAKDIEWKQGGGCKECHGLGYQGRIGIYEIITMSKELEQLILDEKISEYAIQELAISQGTVTMVQDGILKAAEGITTISEVFRVAESLE